MRPQRDGGHTTDAATRLSHGRTRARAAHCTLMSTPVALTCMHVCETAATGDGAQRNTRFVKTSRRTANPLPWYTVAENGGPWYVRLCHNTAVMTGRDDCGGHYAGMYIRVSTSTCLTYE